jgi:hypothetical protein
VRFSRSKKAMATILALLCLFACPSTEESGSAWVQINRAFVQLASIPNVKPRGISSQAYQDLQILALSDASRIRFRQLADNRMVNAKKRSGLAVFIVDGWPLDVAFDAAMIQERWVVLQVTNLSEIRHTLSLLGPTGLPRELAPNPWAGGLSGRDEQNRPNAAILLSSNGHRLSIDGAPLKTHTTATIIEGLRRAFDTRKRLSNAVFATYRPHVALALPVDVSVRIAIELVEAATRSGASSIQALVRTEQGPAWLPIAVTRRHPKVLKSPLELRVKTGRVIINELGANQSPIYRGSLSKPSLLINAISAANPKGIERGSLVISVDNETQYGVIANLISALIKSDPHLNIALRSKP